MKMISFLLVLGMFFSTVPTTSASAEVVSDFVVMQDDGTLVTSIDSSGYATVDVKAIAKKFYQTHSDAYDFLGVFTDFPMYSGGFGREGSNAVKNEISGIGLPIHNDTLAYGSAGKLQTVSVLSAVNNVIEKNPFDDDVVDSLNYTLMHEIVHRWGIFVGDKFDMTNKDPQARGHYMPSGHMFINPKPIPNNNNIYGYRDIMGGEDVLKNDDGTYTTYFLGNTNGVSPLTLYLMGLYSEQEVPPITVLHNAKDDYPTAETTSSIVTIQDIIADSGRRVPSVSDAQKDFKTAIILVTKKGVAPKEKTMRYMKRIASEFPQYWAQMTRCRSTMSADLAMTNAMKCSPVSSEKTTATISDPKPLYTKETVLTVTVRDADGNTLPHRRVRMIPQAGDTRTTKRQVGEQFNQIMADQGVWANGSYMSLTYLLTDASGNARFTLRSGNPYATGRDADMNLAPSSYRYNVIVDGMWLPQKPVVEFVKSLPQEQKVSQALPSESPIQHTKQSTPPSSVAKALRGAILLQVQERGEAWYVRPDTAQRVFLGRPADAFSIMRELGLGVSHDFVTTYKHGVYPDRVAGKILIDVGDYGKAYYIYPKNKRAYYLGRPADAFSVMRELGLGISNSDLEKVEQFSL